MKTSRLKWDTNGGWWWIVFGRGKRLACASVLLLTCFCRPGQSFDESADVLAIQDALQDHDFAKAETLLAQAMNRRPSDGGLLNLRGILHAERNEAGAARKDFEEATRRTPGLIAAWQNLGRSCQSEAMDDRAAGECAVKAWSRVLQARPVDDEAHTGLAVVYAQKGKFTASLNELSHLSQHASGQAQYRLLRCADLAAVGRGAEAQIGAEELAKREDVSDGDFAGLRGCFAAKSASVVTRVAQGVDDRGDAGIACLRALAMAEEQLGNAAKARVTLERVARLDPRNTAHLLELARLAHEAGDNEGAIGYLAHARDLEPKNGQVHYLYAMIASDMDLPVEARSSLEKALALEPDNPAYNFAMGFVILNTRDPASAVNYFQKFVTAHPDVAKGHYALAIARYASGDFPQAKGEFLRVQADREVAGAAAYFLGRIARQEEHREEAVRHLRRSIDLMPDYAESHTELARIDLQKGDLKEAEAELLRAIQLDDRSFQANSQLLVVYRRTHDPRAAAQASVVMKLNEERSKRAELMLRTIEVRP